MAGTKPLRILLVEDNPGDARLIQTYLGNGHNASFDVRTVGRLRDALIEIESSPPDAILLDLGLPDSQGLDAIDRVTAVVEMASAIIVLTGLNDEETALLAIQHGAQDYLAKGAFDSELLVRTIRYAVERSLAEMSLRTSEERYRNLFEQANEAVLVVCDSLIQTANPKTEMLFGWTLAELVGRSFAELVHPEDRSLVMDQSECRMLEDNTPRQYEFRVISKDAETRWVEVSTTRIDWEGKVAALSLLTDITNRKHAEQRTAGLLARQVSINELTLALGTTTDAESICSILHEHVRRLLDADGFLLSMYDARSREIRAAYVVARGEVQNVHTFPTISVQSNGGIQSQVIQSREGLHISNWDEIARDGETHDFVHDARTSRLQSALLAPMLYQGIVIGVLQLQSCASEAYSAEDLNLLCGLANVAAIALRNSQLVQESRTQAKQLKAAFEGIVQTVSTAIGTRDPYTGGHQQRVARIAKAIAETLGMDAATIEGVRVAGLVHDIGKLGIPAEILAKPGALTDIEFEIIRSHAETGYRILKTVDFPWPIADIVHQHHERLDGSGYPRGIAGEELLLEARIIGVADVVEAMASHRPYRPALGLDRALEEIEAHKGTVFDSQAVEACLALFRERGYSLDAPADEQ